jgi:hypothetical protein
VILARGFIEGRNPIIFLDTMLKTSRLNISIISFIYYILLSVKYLLLLTYQAEGRRLVLDAGHAPSPFGLRRAGWSLDAEYLML